MPRKPLTPCRYPYCPKLCEGAYCDEHKKLTDSQYNKFGRDKVSQKFYESAEWKTVRALKLKEQPLCQDCMRDNRFARAKMVDHITPIKDGGSPLGLENLQSLCWACHSRKSAKEGSRWGK